MKFRWPFVRGRTDAAASNDYADPETKGVFFTPQPLAWDFSLPGQNLDFAGGGVPGQLDYAYKTQNGMYSSVVTSALCWMMRTFPEAPCVVQRSVQERWETVANHSLARLISKPNPEYGGRVLWMATIMDFCYGEAFWLKIRNGGDSVVELHWVPRGMITPMSNPETPGQLDYYAYRPGYGVQRDLLPRDVVHFRFGKDPRFLLRGFSPLAAVMREVFTDDQASDFTASVLSNLGIIGILFSPKTGMIPEEQAKKLKAYIQENFTGRKRGQAMMFTGPTDATLMQYNLGGFDVGPIRDIAEERVCAALAIPAAVIGFGTGLQQTKVGATMREMVKLAWQGGIEPLQAIIADELDRSLLPEFQKNDALFRTHFDTTQVEALTESPAEKTDRVIKLTEGNIITIAQAQRELGYPVDSTQDKYLRELVPGPVTPALPPPRNRLQADANASASGTGPSGDENAVPAGTNTPSGGGATDE